MECGRLPLTSLIGSKKRKKRKIRYRRRVGQEPLISRGLNGEVYCDHELEAENTGCSVSSMHATPRNLLRQVSDEEQHNV